MPLHTDVNACAIILAGGQGSRVRGLHPDLPKPMFPAGGAPFLEWVIRYLAGQGVRSMVVSLGHLAPVIERYLAGRPADGLSIRSIREPGPLGTGGAIRFARREAGAADLLVAANGDSLVLADLVGAFALFGDPGLEGVLVGIEVDDCSRYGSLESDRAGRLRGFREKAPGRGLINAGIYLLRPELVDRFPDRSPLSLEKEVIPGLLAAGARLAVHPSRAAFLDIGTPETAALADGFIRSHFQEAGA